MNLGLQLSRQFSNRWIFFLQPFPHCGRILFVRSSHRLLRGQTPGSQIASHRPHRNLQIEFSRQQILHRFPRPQCKGQVQLVRTTTDNVAHRRGCLMWCQSRNWRPSSTSRFQRSTSYAFHQPPPAAHRTSSYPENPSRLGLRKTFLNGLNGSPAKVFLSFRRQRASILFSHARHATTLPSDCHLYYAPISKAVRRIIRGIVCQPPAHFSPPASGASGPAVPGLTRSCGLSLLYRLLPAGSTQTRPRHLRSRSSRRWRLAGAGIKVPTFCLLQTRSLFRMAENFKRQPHLLRSWHAPTPARQCGRPNGKSSGTSKWPPLVPAT